MRKALTIKQALILLILFSAIVRGFIAGFINLGNDEVYYWTYALFPDLSHFDHPPMIGWIIQFFTLNLHFQSEFFIRLASIIIGSINTWIIFLLGKKIKDELTGLYAALLYTTSIYCSIIVGTFIMPDTPLVLFWLLSLILLFDALPSTSFSKRHRSKLLLAGACIGLAMLSKYHGAYLWIGAVLYIIFYNPTWLRKKELYLSVLISCIFFLPVILWNINNNFISFTFHGERVDVSEGIIHTNYFLTELTGQFLYNNPINFILIIISLIALFRKKISLPASHKKLLILFSLPLIILFLVFSLFRSTLPHWSAPAYLCLILLSAVYLSQRNHVTSTLLPSWIRAALYLLIFIIILGIGQMQLGWISTTNDVTLDMYGWKQLNKKFTAIVEKDIAANNFNANAPIITYRWFPAAHLDYYVGFPMHKNIYALGSLERIHKYAWINTKRGFPANGSNAYYLAFSNDYKDPHDFLSDNFQEILLCDTIHILRNKKIVKDVYIYHLLGYKNNFESIKPYK